MKKIKENLSRINVFIKDNDKKGLAVLIKEVIVLWYLRKRFPLYYFGRFLYRRGIKNYKDYLSFEEYTAIIDSPVYNQKEYTGILNNKLAFSFFCEQNNVPSPKTLGYNMKNTFFSPNGQNQVNSQEEFAEFTKVLFRQTDSKRIFLKTLADSGGKGVYLITEDNMDSFSGDLLKKILNSGCIYQEGVIQHDLVNNIFPSSVNTVRVDTYIDNSGKSHVLDAFMRIGTGNNHVDNVSSGGLFVIVDKEKGILDKYALQGMIHGGQKITHHPDTNVEFSGFEIPFFEEVKEFCLELTKQLPNRLIGWDIAITPNGPVVLEGNPRPGFILGEFYHKGYRNHPLGKEMLASVSLS